MPFVLRPFDLLKPTSRILYLSSPQTPGNFSDCGDGGSHSWDGNRVPGQFPLTPKQVDDQIQEFIDSVDLVAVCRLASDHNDQIPCTITGQENGSFNVCFLVRFSDNTTWVVRIPLNPVVMDSWAKIESEVATMKYLENKTTIPVPHVYGYGKGEHLAKSENTTMAFMIYEYIPGHSLSTRKLEHAKKERRLQFFNELIDFLTELRQLEFPAAGSLFPNENDNSEPIVGGLMTMAANELQRSQPNNQHRKVFTSAKSFLEYELSILSELTRLPSQNLRESQVREELFAIDSLETQIPKLLDSHLCHGPFVLAHQDLRCGNIIVTEDLHILGIIDWEFAATVPVQCYTPPPWITGHGRSGLAILCKDVIRHDFQHALEVKAATSKECATLMHEWAHRPSLVFPAMQILRQPDSLLDVYYRFLFDKLFDGDRKQTIEGFFKQGDKQGLLAEVDIRMNIGRLYQRHLEENGLLTGEGDVEMEREILAAL